jgi:hypothetical protein
MKTEEMFWENHVKKVELTDKEYQELGEVVLEEMEQIKAKLEAPLRAKGEKFNEADFLRGAAVTMLALGITPLNIIGEYFRFM